MRNEAGEERQGRENEAHIGSTGEKEEKGGRRRYTKRQAE